MIVEEPGLRLALFFNPVIAASAIGDTVRVGSQVSVRR